MEALEELELPVPKPAEADLLLRMQAVAHCLALGIQQVDQVLHTAEPDATIDAISPLVAPLGRIVCLLPIGRPVATADLFARSIRLEYELMFTRSLFGVDLAHQGAILDRVADLVDTGVLASTLSCELPWTLGKVALRLPT